MPTFSLYDGLTKVIEPLGKAFTFIFNALRGLLSKINAEPLFFIPLALALMLGIAFWAAWTVMEASQYAGGSPYANPNRQFGRLANPNKQYDTKMPLWSSLGRHFLRKNQQDKSRRESENEMAQAAYEKIVEEQEALENKHRIHEQNQQLANKYFANNKRAFKINIDGETFFRDGWENKAWDREGELRTTTTFRKSVDSKGNVKYIPIRHSYSSTTSQKDYVVGKSQDKEESSFDLDEAVEKATLNSARWKK